MIQMEIREILHMDDQVRALESSLCTRVDKGKGKNRSQWLRFQNISCIPSSLSRWVGRLVQCIPRLWTSKPRQLVLISQDNRE